MASRNDKTERRQCCKSSGASLTQSVRETLEGSHEDPRVPAFDVGSGDNVHEGGGGLLSLSVYTDADYASKETDRRLISSVAVMLGNAALYASSRTQHCVTLSTTEAEYVALAEGAKEGMFVRSVMSSIQPIVSL